MATLTQKCSACQRSPMGRCLSHTTLPFGQYGPSAFGRLNGKWGRYPARTEGLEDKSSLKPGKTFDEVPLGYLDWLSGQAYVDYGWLRQRLTAYLTRDVIQRELNELFPDPEDDSRKPLFWIHPDCRTRDTVTCDLAKTQQRREAMPKEYRPELDPEDIPVTYARAWEIVADAIASLEEMVDVNDWLEIDHQLLKRAVQKLGANFHFTLIRQLREAYRTCRLRLQAIRLEKRTPAHEYQGPAITVTFHFRRYSKGSASAWATKKVQR